MHADVTSPMAPFRLDLERAAFSDSALRSASSRASAKHADRHATRAIPLSVGENIARCFFVSQVLITTTLLLVLLIVLSAAYRSIYYFNYAYDMFGSYTHELATHALRTAENVHSSSVALTHVMTEADAMASTSLTKIGRVVNETTDMADKFSELLNHPRLQLSLN